MTPAEWREDLAQVPVGQRELLSEGGGALLLFRGPARRPGGKCGEPRWGISDSGGAGGRQKMKPRLGLGQAGC